MNDIILPLIEKLIPIKSTSNDKEGLQKCLEFALSNIQRYTIERFESSGIKSVLVYNTKQRPQKFKIILNGHLDIIPGKEYQYVPYIKGKRLYGVGSMDMKASVATFITVFKELADKVNYPLGLQLVTDEETGGFHGTKHQIDKGVRADFVVVGETTNFHIENQAKGIVWLKIRSQGKSAHGAYPWDGENAIWKMNHFLKSLEKRFPIPKQKKWITTVNLARIETRNQTFNKIPDDCEVWLDSRYIPQDSKKILGEIEELLPNGFTYDVIIQEPAQFVDENNHYIKQLQKTGKRVINKKISLNQGQGSSDARHYTRVNCAAIEFGPIGEGMGTDNEWVDIRSLNQYYTILKTFLLSLNT